VLLLIRDTNILLDWEEGGCLEALFRLDATLAVPDVLLVEELADRAPTLLPSDMRTAYAAMRASDRRQPWVEVDAQLHRWGLRAL